MQSFRDNHRNLTERKKKRKREKDRKKGRMKEEMKISPGSKKWMKYADRIDNLLETPCHLIDIYPIQVLENSPGCFFRINDWILDNEYELLAGKFFRMLLKLNCYHDLTVCHENRIEKNPAPDLLRKRVRKCFSAKQRKRGYMIVFVDTDRAMLVLNGDDPWAAVYNADENLQALLRMLADSEGMFFRKAPL